MACKNKISQWVDRGFVANEVVMQCGDTSVHGTRLICDECRNDQQKMEAIKRQERNAEADNAWLASCGYGEM